jgi:ketosteroid isomerase-like protein
MEHPNLTLLKRFDPNNVAATGDVFAEDAVWHFFNPRLPELEGDYVGLAGISAFFEKLARLAGGASFEVNLISVTPVGNEFVVLHRKQKMVLKGENIDTDVVVVYRIVEGRIAEVWDIPAVHS